MKNAMKKIMSLVLVAMILVSALPFAASASSTETVDFWIELNVDGVNAGSKTIPVPKGTTMDEATVKQYAASLYATYFGSGYTYTGCYDIGGQAGENGYIGAGIKFETKVADPEPEMFSFWIELNLDGKVVDSQIVSVPKGTLMDAGTVKLYAEKHLYAQYFTGNYNYVGCYDFGGQAGVNGYNGAGVKFTTKPAATTPPATTDKVVDEEWMKDIYLYIYTNNDIIAPAKRVLLNNYMVVKDHTLSKAEILSVVDDYYKATNANNGIIWKGCYMEDANIDAINFVDGRDEAPFTSLDVERSSHSVIIKVRVTGVTAGTNSNADSSNPKTGDTIMVPVAVMTVSASLLAIAFYMNKKRAF